MTKQNTLGKYERLKSRKLIDLVFTEGLRFSIGPFRVNYILQVFGEDDRNILQAAFGAPTKRFRKAVDRNRIKRLSREAYRLQKQPLEQALAASKQKLVLFVSYNATALPEWSEVSEKMNQVINRLIAGLEPVQS